VEPLLVCFTLGKPLAVLGEFGLLRYVFFEKKRIAEGKEKTDLRLNQERAFPKGRDLKNAGRMPWIHDSENADWDELGRIVITSAKGKVLQYIY
jgi:hypothetical protein